MPLESKALDSRVDCVKADSGILDSTRPVSIQSSPPGTRAAYALLYAMMFLLLITFFIMQFRANTAITLDRIVNAHIRFQSQLYLHSLEQAARICRDDPRLLALDFTLDSGYVGGFEIVGKQAFLYIEALNRRTGQILRSTKEITLP